VPLLFWDASALAKRYTKEVGTDTVNALFKAVPATSMATTVWGYAETYSLLLRAFNGERLDRTSFATSTAALQREIISSPDFGFLSVDDRAVPASLPLMQRHNLNTTDATLLAVLLRHARALPPSARRYVLVAADRRFVRASQAEGFAAIDPEQVATADVPTLVAAL
jgi:predicted nucleic acid-binding protein